MANTDAFVLMVNENQTSGSACRCWCEDQVQSRYLWFVRLVLNLIPRGIKKVLNLGCLKILVQDNQSDDDVLKITGQTTTVP